MTKAVHGSRLPSEALGVHDFKRAVMLGLVYSIVQRVMESRI
jgi:hypothetical protein